MWKSSCASAALALRAGALAARHAEAEQVGGAQGEPALGLVGDRQVELASRLRA